jgi:hypothetical protein
VELLGGNICGRFEELSARHRSLGPSGQNCIAGGTGGWAEWLFFYSDFSQKYYFFTFSLSLKKRRDVPQIRERPLPLIIRPN